MKNFDIAIVTGFGNTDIDTLGTELRGHINPRRYTVIPSVTPERAQDAPEDIVRSVSEEIDCLFEILKPEEQLLLMGHSLGSLKALVAACRRKMRGISRLVLIDGPLNGEKVVPVLRNHQVYEKQYREREKFAAECEAALSEMDTSGIINIATRGDRIVPYEAKRLTGLADVEMKSDDDMQKISMSGRGLNITLPSNYKGHSLKPKIPLIAKIVKQAIAA